MTNLRKGTLVFYRNERNTLDIQAIVRRCHRDGSVTVEARFVLDGGERKGYYLGYRLRIPADAVLVSP